MLKQAKIVIVVLSLLAAVTVSAQEPSYPERPRGYVNDYAEVLGDVIELENKLESYEKETTNEIIVVTVSSLADVTIEEYAATLFEKWGIGKEGKDNGVLLLVAVSDRQVRIEVGYGLESMLTDHISASVIQSEVAPAFAEGNYEEGIEKGVEAMVAAVNEEYKAEKKLVDNEGGWVFLVILLIVVLFVIIVPKVGGSEGRNRYSKIQR
jgi:uncharacterized protein